MKGKILVIGYGNTLRQDDGVGVEVVRRLQEQVTDPNCTFVTAFQPKPEMIMQFVEADAVILVDASADIQPGMINRTQLDTIDDIDVDTTMTHFFTPKRMLLLCDELYGYTPRTVLFTIGGHSFGYGEGFSAIIRMRIDRLVAKVLAQIRALNEEFQYA